MPWRITFRVQRSDGSIGHGEHSRASALGGARRIALLSILSKSWAILHPSAKGQNQQGGHRQEFQRIFSVTGKHRRRKTPRTAACPSSLPRLLRALKPNSIA